MPAAYPIFLDLTGQKIVIVGGGAVAERKAAGVIEAGAMHVKVVALAFTGTFADLAERVLKGYEPADLDGASLVFAATDSKQVNDAVVADAVARNIWVNRADAAEEPSGTFTTAAKFASGPVVVAVSAGSAALTARVRNGLALRFDPAWATMAELMITLRPIIRDQSDLSPPARQAVFRDLASDAALALLVEQGTNSLFAWLRSRHPSLQVK